MLAFRWALVLGLQSHLLLGLTEGSSLKEENDLIPPSLACFGPTALCIPTQILAAGRRLGKSQELIMASVLPLLSLL